MAIKDLLISNAVLLALTALAIAGGLLMVAGGIAPLYPALAPAIALMLLSSARIVYQAVAIMNAVDSRSRAIIERAADSIVTTDEFGHIETVNAAAERVFGYRSAELRGHSIATLLSAVYEDPENADLWEFLRTNAIGASGAAQEVIGLRRNGDRFFMELSISDTTINGRAVFIAIIRDNTQKKKAELALRQAHDELEERVEARTADLKMANTRLTKEIAQRRAIQVKQEKTLTELQQATKDIKTLSGMIPICASCKSIRDDSGYWNRLEQYISEHSDAMFSHGICPDCKERLYPELSKKC